MDSAQGTVERKTAGKEAERFICLARIPIKITAGYATQVFDIPDGAEWIKDRRRHIIFYKGLKPEPNGYKRIPSGAKVGEYMGYRDRTYHTIPGEFSFK